MNQDDKSQKIIYKAINKYIAKDLGLNDVDSDYIYNLMNYKCLQIILKYSYKDYKQLMQNSACNIIQNKLEYRLGNALMKAKNPFKLLKLPFTLIRLIRKYRFERKVYKAMITFRPELQLKPLEQYPDYEEALKIKGKLFYKLGEAFVQNPFSFLFKCYRICKSFKNKTIN
ncbi:hypothetical protein CQA53_05565 [Helicobacter didelphidarum]|uniref:Uncharacterized protein n=1 Tax=Helicobacter didelphidarum TaxID=2040648 RepID=A0A3D8IL32_9HELI|nr:hypothetical protein CQA53_05565 [Helicobacter didelphidarum]